jgi:hypothetical protein
MGSKGLTCLDDAVIDPREGEPVFLSIGSPPSPGPVRGASGARRPAGGIAAGTYREVRMSWSKPGTACQCGYPVSVGIIETIRDSWTVVASFH